MSEPAPGRPDITLVRAPNPGPMTLSGTNTYVVAGSERAYVIDPGPDAAGHLDAVREAAAQWGGVAGVLITHSHLDHTAGVAALGAPVLYGKVGDGEEGAAMMKVFAAGFGPPDPVLATEPAPASTVAGFEVVPTPGHAADHVCFIHGDVCFGGDLILGEGSTIVPPAAAGGSLADYMRSLERVAALGARLLAPGHGPWITDPAAKITEYQEHRKDRERRLAEALDGGERSRAELLARVWDDVPEALQPAAAIAMQAHLEKLAGEGHDLSTLTT